MHTNMQDEIREISIHEHTCRLASYDFKFWKSKPRVIRAQYKSGLSVHSFLTAQSS